VNPHFAAFIDLGRHLALERNLAWEIPIEASGKAPKGQGWNLTELAGGVAPMYYLSNLGTDMPSLEALQRQQADGAASVPAPTTLAETWRDLIKATVAEQLFVRRNSAHHVAGNVIRPLRVIATCACGKAPWELTLGELMVAVKIGREIQPSGKLADLMLGLVKVLFDANHLTNVGPLYPALVDQRLNPRTSRRASFLKSQDELRHSLEGRKRDERLPERKAFWELIRIVMTEKPRSFADELRFAGVKLMIATGFRIGEAVMLPADWKREKAYVDRKGRSAAELGGYAKSLMIRHFAEKQQIDGGDSHVLNEKLHYVPRMFEALLVETLDHVAMLTAPLRKTLKLQTESGRLFPWYAATDLIPAFYFYTHLTGNPFWTDLRPVDREQWQQRCRGDLSGARFDELYARQCTEFYAERVKPDMTSYVYFRRLREALPASSSRMRLRRANGSTIPHDARIVWADAYLKVEELEAYVRSDLPTKLPDVEPLKLPDRDLQSWELLFLQPKRSLAEQRNGGLCDINRYISIKRPIPELIGAGLGDRKSGESLFQRYGQSEADRLLTLDPHMLRHLQNTELFRLGVADTIISKRFNRRTVAQSYEYDHRSLAEELDQLEIPAEVEMSLGTKATTVLKMISLGKASGPIIDGFKRIQAEEGDAAAFEYLKVEGDGFHATPYGHCLNSFTVDPCPKHLECFTGCRHLSASDLPEVRDNLVRLENKMAAAHAAAQARPPSTIGRINQIEHARVRLEGIRKLLSTKHGEHPFPEGPDLSIPKPTGLLDD
jgi:hypothetical protein